MTGYGPLILQIFFEYLSVTLIRILSVNKRLKRFKMNSIYCKIFHLYAQKSVCATSTRPFGEVGGTFYRKHILLNLKI